MLRETFQYEDIDFLEGILTIYDVKLKQPLANFPAGTKFNWVDFDMINAIISFYDKEGRIVDRLEGKIEFGISRYAVLSSNQRSIQSSPDTTGSDQ